MRENAGFPADSRISWEAWPNRTNGWRHSADRARLHAKLPAIREFRDDEACRFVFDTKSLCRSHLSSNSLLTLAELAWATAPGDPNAEVVPTE
jgi:hypothetical protein